jgi:hypothetical protein
MLHIINEILNDEYNIIFKALVINKYKLLPGDNKLLVSIYSNSALIITDPK